MKSLLTQMPIKFPASLQNVGALTAKADAYNLSKDWRAAEVIYRSILDIHPRRSELWVQLGHCLKEQGDLDGAAESYRRAADLSKRDPDPLVHLAHCLKRQGRVKEAISTFSNAQALAPSNEEIEEEIAHLRSTFPLVSFPGTRITNNDLIIASATQFYASAHDPIILTGSGAADLGFKLPVDLCEYAKQGGISVEEAFFEFCANPDDDKFNLPENAQYILFDAVQNCPLTIQVEATKSLFDESFYISIYPDLRNPANNPHVHYLLHGWRERRDPSPSFNTSHYLASNREVAEKGINPLLHYALFGRRDGRPIAKSMAKALGPQADRKSNMAIDMQAHLVASQEVRRFGTLTPRPLTPNSMTFNPKRLSLHWVVPDFNPGSGGHMTIFRVCHQLEARGHHITIWIRDPTSHRRPADAIDTLNQAFFPLSAQVRFLDDGFAEASGDIIFATDAFSVPIVNSAEQFKRRFYFVQDFEPSFFPVGTRSILAESTYREDLDCICASPWLEQLMRDRYGRWARSFYLAADRSIYYPPLQEKSRDDLPRIAFYTRMFTERRAVELGLLALEILAGRGVKFHVDFFGQQELPFNSAPFSAQNHGVCTPDELGDIYRRASVGVVFSATNYSLVPQEMMACALPVVELDGESTRAIFPEGSVSFARPNAESIADALEKLLEGGPDVDSQVGTALEWVSKYSWSAAAEIIEAACLDRLRDLGFSVRVAAIINREEPYATVVIPTYNGHEDLTSVISALERQRAPWPVEILCIDSSSTDGTQEFLRSKPSVRLEVIDQTTFQHGRTRNLGVEMARSEFVAFLTQDALPTDELWLFSLVNALHGYPNAGGVCGRHRAYSSTSPFIRRDLEAHMRSIDALPPMIDLSQPEIRRRASDPIGRQILHWYSDNNSCLRKSIWKFCPIPNIDFGEDQAFAWELLNSGFGRVYARSAVVFHSHDEAPPIARKRAYEEARFFYQYFGYRPFDTIRAAIGDLLYLNDVDRLWARGERIPMEALERRLQQNRATIDGRVDAMIEAGTLAQGTVLPEIYA